MLAVDEADDPAAPLTTAREADGGWHLTGAKTTVLAGAEADELLVPTSTPSGAGVFVVDGRSTFLPSAGTFSPGYSCLIRSRKEAWMAVSRGAAELETFLSERADHLLHTAVLLAGTRDAGEDLLQMAVERLLRQWHRLDGDPEGYLRRTLCNLVIDGHRRAGRWRQKERLLRAGLPSAPDATVEVDLRDALVRLLLQLPVRQRAVLVLRYWEELTDAETAAILGCPEGTVKSAGSRGLARLRELAGDWNDTAIKCG